MKLKVQCVIIYGDSTSQLTEVDVNVLIGMPEASSVKQYVKDNHRGAVDVLIVDVGIVTDIKSF